MRTLLNLARNSHVHKILLLSVLLVASFIAGYYKGGGGDNYRTTSELLMATKLPKVSRMATPRLNETKTKKSEDTCPTVSCPGVPQQALLDSLKHLAVAHRYARSGRTLQEVKKSFHIINAVLHSEMNLSTPRLDENQLIKPILKVEAEERDVCPDKYMGVMYGYPYYHKGYLTANCSYGKNMADILTVIVDFTSNPGDLLKVKASLEELHPGIHMIPITTTTGAGDTVVAADLTAKDLDSAIAMVKTKYTLIASGLYHFDQNANLDRLVRMVNYIGVDVAAGSNRNLTGFWKADCYQMKMLNYGLRIVEGYDLSYNSCIYCDYAAGPFVAKTLFLSENTFTGSSFDDELIFLDYFYRLKQKEKVVLNCPDSMFYTRTISQLPMLEKSSWVKFAKHHTLTKFVLPGRTIEISCNEIGYKCKSSPPAGSANAPCCLKILSDQLAYVYNIAERHNLSIEMEAGTNIGAVKFHDILPWELDADLNYLGISWPSGKTFGQDALRQLIPQFSRDGYILTEDEGTAKCKKGGVNCGYFSYRKAPWRVELWGVSCQANDVIVSQGLEETKILIAGTWMTTAPNPGATARNRYEDDVFEHVEHWSVLGHSTSWVTYKTGSWMKCTSPGKHYCLDNFLPVGNIQFQEIWI